MLIEKIDNEVFQYRVTVNGTIILTRSKKRAVELAALYLAKHERKETK